ncbi:hypothetical protein DPMN_068860 [Dreissena polymorpha]|uniref:Uncharacterized protein n=1 Tax=Dreissena polymorpha TaxID=45954 RepID=A0A9D4BWW4_DREPO|nr:hypothetical protein DPMN_068860 [Dreissena polymorpha]
MNQSTSSSSSIPRWNYKKADWTLYKRLSDDLCKGRRGVMDMVSGFDPHRGSVLLISPKRPSTCSRPRKRTRERLYKPWAFDAIELK